MWNLWIVVAMISVSSYYTVSSSVNHPIPAQQTNMNLAMNMATYRQAVIAYATDNPTVSGRISDTRLTKPKNYLPSWYALPSPRLWSNYVASDGTITIYASSQPSTSITADIIALSKNSILAGEAKTNMLYSPMFGDTQIPLPANVAIPNGRPVWMAHRN